MLRSILSASVLFAAVSFTGCATGGGGTTDGASASFDQMTPTQIAAWSATSKYPETAAPAKMDLTVIVNQSQQTIKVYNATGMAVRNAKLWVNKTFVAQIDGIAPQSKVLVKTDRLYDGVGNAFAQQKLEVSTVQLQTDEGLFDLHGPFSE